MDRTFLFLGGLAGFLAVGLGAFGAHALRGRLSPEMLAVFETGVRYQMYHALALILTSFVAARMSGWLIATAGWSFTAGIVLFGRIVETARGEVSRVAPVGGYELLPHASLTPPRPPWRQTWP